MIDNGLRQLVVSEIEAIAPSHGDLSGVLRRGRRRRRTRHVAQTFGVAAVIGLIGIAGLVGTRTVQVPEVAAPEEAADLLLVVVDGDGPGEFAERLAQLSGPPVVPGSATHLGSVTVEAGRLHIVSYRSIGGNPRFPNAEGTCDAVVSEDVDWGEAVCRYDPSETDGIGYGVGDDGYTFFHDSPEGAVLATVTTANGKTIDIGTASTTNLVFGLWELSWGAPDRVDFKDEQGNLIESITFDDIETSPATSTTTTTTVPVPTPVDYGDGLSEAELLPEFLEDKENVGTLLLAEHGVAIHAQLAVNDTDWTYFMFWQGSGRHATFDFGNDYIEGETPLVGMDLVIPETAPTITVFGVAPLGTRSIEVSFTEKSNGRNGPSGVTNTVTIGEFYDRPEVDRSVFAGTFDSSILTNMTPPIAVEVELTGDGDPVLYREAITPSFGFQGASAPLEHDIPITTDWFIVPGDLIVQSVNVEKLPTVGKCERPEYQNEVRTLENGEVYPTPMAAFEAIMASELNDTGSPQWGYIEFIDPEGNIIAYGAPPDWGTLDDGVVILIQVEQVEDGWTVTGWEGSGC